MAHVPAELLYTKSHEWVQFTGETTARVGITDFAQNSLGDIVFVNLGDIVFVNLPAEGDGVTAGEAACDVESVKAVADIVSPVTGTVSAANDALENAPEKLNESPYEAWIFEVSDISDREELLDAAAYEAFCATEEA